MSRNKCFFQVRVSHVLRFMSICDLFTDSPSYFSIRSGDWTAQFARNFRRNSACTKPIKSNEAFDYNQTFNPDQSEIRVILFPYNCSILLRVNKQFME
jgi:hypothetical protein